MKTIALLTVIALSASMLAAPADSGATRIQREDSAVTVSKVITAVDEDASYRAYLVKWKGQEVVVIDFFLQTNYKAGDTMTIVVVKHQIPGTTDGRRTISFSIPPKARGPNDAPDKVMDEVERRRSERDAAARHLQNKAP